jgi:O-antigen ligase
MVEFLRYESRTFYLLVLWTIVGIISINAGVIFITATFILLLLKRFELEMLLGLLLMLVLSDNYYLHFPGIVKPVLLVLLTAYMLLVGEIRTKAFLAKRFLPFFIFTICLWPLSDYLEISIQKNMAYILLFATVPPVFYHLYSKMKGKAIEFIAYFLLLILILNVVYRFYDPYFAYSHGGRLRGFFGNPNGLGMFCFFSLLFFELARLFFKVEFTRMTRYIFYGVAFLLLVLTASRASIFATLIFYGFLFLSRYSIILAFASLFLFIGMFQYLVEPFVQLLIDLGLGESLRLTTEGAEALETGSGRIVAWNFAWEQIQHNFFFGKAWAHEEELFHSEGIQTYLNALNHEGGAHNVFLIFWMNTGIVGLLLFFVPFVQTFVSVMKKSPLALPVLLASLFLAFFEPWLAAALNPYTIIVLMIMTALVYCNPEDEEVDQVA